MEPAPSRVRVRILGDEYTIVGDADERTILALAETVEERMRELQNAMPQASKTKIAVLCAMNIADELAQWKLSVDINPSEHPEIEEKTKKIISLLEEGIIGENYL